MNVRKALLVISLLTAIGGPLSANTANLTLLPSGSILGTPGGPASGWGFRLDWESPVGDWLSVTVSSLTFETNPGMGAYSDFIGPQGGPTDNAMAPDTSWIEAFSLATSQGIGEYAVYGSQPLGAYNSGTLVVNYDLFDGDPMLGASQIDSGQLSAPFGVTAVPEPSSLILVALMLVPLGWRVWMVRRRTNWLFKQYR